MYVDSPESLETHGSLCERASSRGAKINVLGDGVLKRVADAVNPQGVLAIAQIANPSLATLAGAGFVLVCVDTADPGNVGTIVRAAAAAGAQAVVVCDGSVDVYNPKTVRASAGAVFHLPVVSRVAAVEALKFLGTLGFRRVGAVARGGEPYDTLDVSASTAIVLGSESHGIPPDVAGELDAAVSIPMGSRSESLNVAMAATVLSFEVARRVARRKDDGAGYSNG